MKHVPPEYPQLARQAKITGTVSLSVVVAKDGTVQNIHVIRGHPALVGAAMEAVRQWIFEPFLQNGSPVEATIPVAVSYRVK